MRPLPRALMARVPVVRVLVLPCAVALLGLAACGPDEAAPASPEAIRSAYAPLQAELVSTISGLTGADPAAQPSADPSAGPAVADQSPRIGLQPDGSCTWHVGPVALDGPRDPAVDDVIGAVDPVLDERGFSPLERDEDPSVPPYYTSRDEHGATVTLDARSMMLTVSVPVDPGSAACDEGLLGG